jgi:hypothetical protein
MKTVRIVIVLTIVAWTASALQAQDFLDRLDESLTFTAFHDNVRARFSGTLDLEIYHFQQPAPALIDSHSDTLFNPRLSLFFDAQLGAQVYFFVQSRVDRGFDPANEGAQVRLDEYAVRVTPWEDGRFTFQVGTFATVVGNWIPRHLSWDNPFINAPFPYENATPIEDKMADPPGVFTGRLKDEKSEYDPVIWGPSYASGASVSGQVGQFDYAAEIKNSSLSSRPQSWHVTEIGFDHPTVNARLGFRPSPAWNLGVSASEGTFFRPEAQFSLPSGTDIGDFHERVLGQDVSFAWHHLQLWAEFYEARFELPFFGDADTFIYYFEAKYKFTPQLFGAIRWNQQFFSDVPALSGGTMPWGSDAWRIDLAAGYRFTDHTQLKLQYSLQHEENSRREFNHLVAAQFTIRF